MLSAEDQEIDSLNFSSWFNRRSDDLSSDPPHGP